MLFARLSLIGTVLALCVVVLGAYVRLSDAGLGCPDWPGCYGQLTVPQSKTAIEKAQEIFPHSQLHTVKAWKEMAHRYLAGTLGLVVLAMFLTARDKRDHLQVNVILPSALLGIIIFQALLGMWTVTLLLKPVIVTAHLMGGMTTLALLTWIAHRHWGQVVSNDISIKLRIIIRCALLILFAQIFLGGWTSANYAALACTDFPTCHGEWIPPLDFKDAFHMIRALGQSAYGGNMGITALSTIQWVHRMGALVTLIYLSILAGLLLNQPAYRQLAMLLLLAVIAQVIIGIANLVLQLPLVLAVAHNMGAALLVVIIIIINSKVTYGNSTKK